MLLKVVWKYHSLVEPSATQIAVKVFPKKTSFVSLFCWFDWDPIQSIQWRIIIPGKPIQWRIIIPGKPGNLGSRNRCNVQRYWAVTIAQRQTLGFGCGT